MVRTMFMLFQCYSNRASAKIIIKQYIVSPSSFSLSLTFARHCLAFVTSKWSPGPKILEINALPPLPKIIGLRQCVRVMAQMFG